MSKFAWWCHYCNKAYGYKPLFVHKWTTEIEGGWADWEAFVCNKCAPLSPCERV